MSKFIIQYQDVGGNWRKKSVTASDMQAARRKLKKRTKGVSLILSAVEDNLPSARVRELLETRAAS